MRFLVFFLLIGSVYGEEIDSRYCTIEPVRTAEGRIKRDMSEVAKFKRIHPCPSTMLRYGSCGGWAVDHIIPLAVGGCDTVNNMQWLPDSIKSCSKDDCKDRWERTIYKR